MVDRTGSLNTSDSHDQLDATLQRADQLRIQGQWTDALALLADTRRIAEGLGLLAHAKHNLATARVLTDQAGFGGFDTYAERTAYLDSALTDAQQTDDIGLLGAVWDARGMSLHHQYLDTGQSAEPPEELSSFEHGLHYRQQVGDQHGVAESLFHIGMVYGVVRQDHKQALPFFEQSYALAQSIGDTVTASYAIRHSAFAQHDAGDTQAARSSLQESLQLRERAHFVPGVAMALAMLAYADFDLGNRQGGLGHLERAKAIFTDLHAPNKVAWVEQLISEFREADE